MTRPMGTTPPSPVSPAASAALGTRIEGGHAGAVPCDMAGAEKAGPGAHWETIAGEHVAFLPERGVWWHGAQTLVVADVHLGKAEAFAAAGAALNGGVLDESLGRIASLVQRLNAVRVIVVGDLLHARAGMTSGLVERVREWRRSVCADIVVVPGNHDRHLASVAREWDLRVSGLTLMEAPFGFVHDPIDVPAIGDGHVWWVGHVHPCVWLGGRGDGLKLPCFIVASRVVTLPAFSVFTSGARVRPALSDRVHVIADGTVVPLNRA